MKKLADYTLQLGGAELRPIMIGGMGVDISSAELALAACRLGGIGHISDAMAPFVSDKNFRTKFTKIKGDKYQDNRESLDKTSVKFDLEDLRKGQLNHIEKTMNRKHGDGKVFVNIMEKLGMADPAETLRVRMNAALDGGIDGITLSAGLHLGTLKLVENNPRFRDAKIGIIVSSDRALKIFLRSASKVNRMPDYIVVEGPLAGGHLGFGEDWAQYKLENIVVDVLNLLKAENLNIPVIPAGGIFTGTDAVNFMELGAAGVQVATRFTISTECGLPPKVKQEYLRATEEEIVVNMVSPTGYPMRMLSYSPALQSNIRPNCEALGYVLNKEGKCQYVDAYANTGVDSSGKKLTVSEKICLCYHFSTFQCYTCGHNVYRLKDTTIKQNDGSYFLPSAEHIFNDYLYSVDHQLALPKVEAQVIQPIGAFAAA